MLLQSRHQYSRAYRKLGTFQLAVTQYRVNQYTRKKAYDRVDDPKQILLGFYFERYA